MPDQRLALTRATLPLWYQYGDTGKPDGVLGIFVGDAPVKIAVINPNFALRVWTDEELVGRDGA